MVTETVPDYLPGRDQVSLVGGGDVHGGLQDVGQSGARVSERLFEVDHHLSCLSADVPEGDRCAGLVQGQAPAVKISSASLIVILEA